MFGKVLQFLCDGCGCGVLMVLVVKREYYKKFFNEVLFVELYFYNFFQDVFVIEISMRMIEFGEDVINWVIFIYFYC